LTEAGKDTSSEEVLISVFKNKSRIQNELELSRNIVYL
jgi:hypothetical protein